MIRGFAQILGLLLLAGAGACAGAQPLPRWLTEEAHEGGDLTLSQTVTFAGSGVRVCGTLMNGSREEAIIDRIPDVSGQFLTYFLNERNVPLRDDNGNVHSSFIPPPAPSVAGGQEPYEVLGPNARLSNCRQISVPQSHSRIRVVSSYTPDLNADYVPASMRAGRRIISREYGMIFSNSCWITVRRRTVRCD